MRELLDLKSAADVRAAIARDKLKLYLLAARVQVHPSRLSLIVNGRAPLTQELAGRLALAIAEETETRSA
jgi:plasmid maintenance system antidote protein VapI